MTDHSRSESLSPPPRVTLDQVRADVAAILDVDPSEIVDTDNLMDFGLDSIRLMTLVERWRAAGLNVSFAELAEWPELRRWTETLARSQST